MSALIKGSRYDITIILQASDTGLTETEDKTQCSSKSNTLYHSLERDYL